jgi:uncharacterized OsmC-like protein
MMGTFGGALEARHIDASAGRLTADVRGEIESDEGTLVIRRIHVTLRLRGAKGQADVVERVHGVFARKCPVYRSLEGAVAITSSFELVD